MLLGTRTNFKGMFGLGDFGKDGKKFKKKIWEKMVGKSIWLEGEDGEKIEHWSPPKINLPKSGRKQRRKFAFSVQTSKSLFAL